MQFILHAAILIKIMTNPKIDKHLHGTKTFIDNLRIRGLIKQLTKNEF